MKVVGLFASSQRGLPRPELEGLELQQDFGVVGDRKAGKSPNRQVLLLGQATYEYLHGEGLELPLGALGENILLNFDPMGLAAGTKLAMGDAVLQTTLKCSPCAHLYAVWPQLKGQMAGRRGMLARVLQSGAVRQGDAVGILQTE